MAIFESRRGRAHLKVERKDSVIYMTASCDSLLRQVEYYAQLSNFYHYRTKNLSDSLKVATLNLKEKQSPTIFQFIAGKFILLFCLGIIIVGIGLYKKSTRLWQ